MFLTPIIVHMKFTLKKEKKKKKKALGPIFEVVFMQFLLLLNS